MTAHAKTPDETPKKHHKLTRAERKHKLAELLETFDTGFLVSHAKGGADGQHYHGRPMALAHKDDNGDLWFVTGVDSAKAKEINGDPRVLVTFQGAVRFVALTGTASIVRDRAKVDEVWNAGMKVWFPEGKDDPNIALLKVDAEEAEYWDNSGAKGLKYLFEAAKALITRSTPEVAQDDALNAKVKL